MYQQYKGYPYHDKSQLSWQTKRPLSTYTNLSIHTDKSSNKKSISWNIEESKENVSFSKTQDYLNKYDQNITFQSRDFQNNYLTPKKQRKYQQADYSKTIGVKSFRKISIPNQFEHQYQFSKTYGNLTQDFKSYQSKTSDLKGLAMSMGYKSTLKDLLPNFSEEECKYEDKKSQKEVKGMKSSRSLKRIHVVDLQKSYQPSPQLSFKNQYSSKSYKKLGEFFTTQKPKNNENLQRIMMEYDKAERTLKDDYKEKLNVDQEFEKIKRLLPNQSQKQKEFVQNKHGLSIFDFQLGACKGQGAFGQVFPAIHKATKMLVAIKKVAKQKVKYMLDQFINEIKIQMFLDHPNIVKLYAFFDDSTHFYIVMEYMEGGSLFSYIKKKKKLSPQETSRRIKQVCLGLKQMHENSILHRDIKPQNIVITNDVCKLCDFGWSAVCKDRRTTYCGTLDYISPQIVGGEGYDDSVDIWCIGVLAYEMICGKTPFYNISRTQTVKKIKNAKYQYPPELTPKAKQFIDKILKKNPEDRLDIEQVLKDSFLAQQIL